jgi:uncharacterized protein (DUF2252 family)
MDGDSTITRIEPEARSALDIDREGTKMSAVDDRHATSESPAQAGKVAHPSVAERVARGKAARAEVGRKAHAEWEPVSSRRDPEDLLEEQAQTRAPELVPIRHGRMLVSPFTFYRGAAYLMAADLAGTARTGLHTQLCGDAHLSNFGVFAAPDRRLVFSINDFDETLPGPFEWDVKRLAASIAVAGRDRGFDRKTRAAINRTVGQAYREGIRRFAGMGVLALWYARIDIEAAAQEWLKQASAKQVQRYEANIAKTRTKDSVKAFGKLTEIVDGEPRIVADPPVVVPVEDVVGPEHSHLIENFFRGVIRSYRRTLSEDRRTLLEHYRYVHAARKVVGVGSVGTRAWILLLLGRDDRDPLFLQVKEAQASVLEPFLGKSKYANHGQRVVEGQRLTQAASDIMLGWIRAGSPLDSVKRDFYVRQLWDAKGSALIEQLEPNAMTAYARLCSTELARAHARAGDGVAIASYLGSSDTFDRAIAQFAEAYADQNERDYSTLIEAVKAGKITAETGI